MHDIKDAIRQMDEALARLKTLTGGWPKASRRPQKPEPTEPPAGAVLMWFTTAEGEQSRGCDGGQRGWRVHAVPALIMEKFSETIGRAALCGLRPARGWGIDMFVDEPCKACEAAAKRKGIILPDLPVTS